MRPNSPAIQPLMGSTMAFETRYDVSTQVLSSLLAPRLPAMCGNATLAMLVSSTSMNAARETTMAISHGLWLGRQISGAGAPERASVRLDIDFRIHRHARPQPMVVVLSGFDIDPHRHPLHDLDEIARGILRRQ